MTRKTAKEVNKPTGMASADLEENGVPVSEKGAENLIAASSKQRDEMAAPADTNAKPTSAAGRATNGASVRNEVAQFRDSWLDRLERNLDKVIAFLSEGHVDDENDHIWALGLERAKMATAKMAARWRICPVRVQMPRKIASSLSHHPQNPSKARCLPTSRDLKLEQLPLSEDLATMVHDARKKKTSEEAAKLLQVKAAECGAPGNCTELAVPWVEDLVWDQLDMQTWTRDEALQGLQHLQWGLMAVAQAMDAIMAKDEERHFWVWSSNTLRRHQIHWSYKCGPLH